MLSSDGAQVFISKQQVSEEGNKHLTGIGGFSEVHGTRDKFRKSRRPECNVPSSEYFTIN
jgi:hypothetical protein